MLKPLIEENPSFVEKWFSYHFRPGMKGFFQTRNEGSEGKGAQGAYSERGQSPRKKAKCNGAF